MVEKKREDFGVVRTLRAASLKPRPDLPFMTRAERNVMDDLEKAGRLGVYRAKKCERKPCFNDVITSKKYCSEACFKADNPAEENDDGEEREEDARRGD